MSESQLPYHQKDHMGDFELIENLFLSLCSGYAGVCFIYKC